MRRQEHREGGQRTEEVWIIKEGRILDCKDDGSEILLWVGKRCKFDEKHKLKKRRRYILHEYLRNR